MSQIKLSDWVAQTLADNGIADIFMLTGGGAMHLNHSLGTHPALTTTFTHHEQALSMAAEAYYRLTNRLAVVNGQADYEGMYEGEGIAPGIYQLTVRSAGYIPHTQTVVLKAGEVDEGVIHLKKP